MTIRKLGIACGLVFAYGCLQAFAPEQKLHDYLYPMQRDACLQLGAIGLIWYLIVLVVGFISKDVARDLVQRAKPLAIKLTMSLSIAFVTGEVALRVYFWDGMSFGGHGGPIVKRYERDFTFNRYTSRGPDAPETKPTEAIRIVVQGDSITWGQGVREVDALYTSRLLKLIQNDNPNFEMAVLADTGREIDYHYEQLKSDTFKLQPDVIIYQWYVNDLEVQGRRPRRDRIWRKLFFHRVLKKLSYFWFFLNYRLDELLSYPEQPYVDYMAETYGSDTPEWALFAETFHKWAAEAKARAPRVLVMLYPALEKPHGDRLHVIHEKVARLGRDTGVEVLDLAAPMADLQGKTREVSSTKFDPHPNTMVHGRMADNLYKWMKENWPEIFESHGATPPGSG